MGISESTITESVMNSTPQKIYILKLIAHKYYVGRTTNVERRYIQHNSGEGSEWTRKYKPINIIETKDAISPFDEDKNVLEYMEKYGMENVRGGSYANSVLSIEQKTYITRVFNGANDRCYKCNSEGHFVKQCTTMINNCTRCGRNNHNSDKCYAKTHFNGLILSAITSDDEVAKNEMSKYNHIERLTDTKDLRLLALLKT